MSDAVAFGVEPGRRAPYELRQARYQALAEIAAPHIGRINEEEGRPADLVDVGAGEGRTFRYLEPHLGSWEVNLTGVDLFPLGTDRVYRREDWRLLERDLEEGLSDFPSEAWDVVVCEQVLEHLESYRTLLDDLERILRPGGLLIVGVPIFPFGLHRLRSLAVRAIDRLRGPQPRSHVQAWSLATFLQDLEDLPSLKIRQARGFRIVSGGPLRALECQRWWWRFNRWVGTLVPGLCVEAQVILEKHPAARAASRR